MGSSTSLSESSASSRTFGMKSGVQPWIGCGLKAGCEEAGEPSSLRSCAVPETSRPASAGSASTILSSGHFSLSFLPAPWKVPPVP